MKGYMEDDRGEGGDFFARARGTVSFPSYNMVENIALVKQHSISQYIQRKTEKQEKTKRNFTI